MKQYLLNKQIKNGREVFPTGGKVTTPTNSGLNEKYSHINKMVIN